jgi:hypothetical protein
MGTGATLLTLCRPPCVSAAAPAFVPTDIAGLALWLDGSDATTLFTDGGTTLVASDGDAVQQWNDKSGNARHVSNGGGNTRPLYKTAVQNSKSAVRFDGSNDYLRVTSSVVAAQPITVFIVVDMNGDGVITDGVNIGSRCTLAYGVVTGGKLSLYGGTAWVEGVHTRGAVHSYRAVYNGASSASYVDGVQLATGSAGTNALDTGFTVGSSRDTTQFNTSADVCEVLIYDSVLSAGNASSVESYLASKWGI